MANGSNPISERLISFRVYDDENKDLLGVATVDLPSIEFMSDTVSGAGVSGEVESPVLGHTGSITTTLTWRSIEKEAVKLCQQKAHAITVRGSQQVYDSSNGTYNTVAIRCSMRVVPKTVSLGSFEPGATTDTEQEFEVLYLKLFIADKEVCEIDKYNFICKFGGEDALASVRKDLGLN